MQRIRTSSYIYGIYRSFVLCKDVVIYTLNVPGADMEPCVNDWISTLSVAQRTDDVIQVRPIVTHYCIDLQMGVTSRQNMLRRCVRLRKQTTQKIRQYFGMKTSIFY